MFHQVNDDSSTWKDDSVSIKAESFRSMIDNLIKDGYSFIPISEIDQKIKKTVIITFDDVYDDAIKNAVSYLDYHKIPFCIFVSSCFIDQEGYISTKQLKLLSNDRLCTIGFHSESHQFMRRMNDAQIERQLNSDDLERIIQRKIDYFAFPYGSVYACGFKSARLSKDLYKYSFSTISAKCSNYWLRHFPYYLPRINVNEKNWRKINQRLK